jgi:hypothetical protein
LYIFVERFIEKQEQNPIFLMSNPFYGNEYDPHKLDEQKTMLYPYIEVQIHKSIQIKEDVKSLHCPISLQYDELFKKSFDKLKSFGIGILYYDKKNFSEI